MFKITPNATFKHNVTVMTPIDNGHEEETLVTTFRYRDADQLKGFDLHTADGTTGFLEETVVTFHDLVDDNNVAIDCSADIRARLFRRQSVRNALIKHYSAAVTKVKEGN